jgi:hypothetical protein
MGDPTLRMHMVSPPVDFRTETSDEGTYSELIWSNPPDDIAGYYVYRSGSMVRTLEPVDDVNFELLTPDPITDTFWVDTPTAAGEYLYMVRSVKLEQSHTGTYYNLSQGVFDFAVLTGIPGNTKYTGLQFKLYPSPAQDIVNLHFALPVTGDVTYQIYDLKGSIIKTTNSRQLTAGEHLVNLDISDLSTGVYYCRVSVDKYKKTRSLLILK